MAALSRTLTRTPSGTARVRQIFRCLPLSSSNGTTIFPHQASHPSVTIWSRKQFQGRTWGTYTAIFRAFHDGPGLSDGDIDDILAKPKEISSLRGRDLGPGEPHRMFILQPHVKWGPGKDHRTDSRLLLDESISLVRTLRWTIVETAIYSTVRPGKKQIFGKGTFRALCERISKMPGLTAVFVSMDRLSSAQQKELEDMWNLKIFDRYTLVLEIFKLHARTKEAKLQIALAEIPVLRSRLRMKDEDYDQQSGSQQYIGGRGETYLEVRQRVLADRAMKLKKALNKLKMKRSLLRKGRDSRQYPVVAVVGYTNAGKTSLIQRLTGDPDLEPRDELFATLDVTAHRGTLPNGMPVIFLDTVGFISNLPHDLVASFSATLQDVLLADIILHIRDISHPDTVSQKDNVLRVLREIGLPDNLMYSIVEVCNKCDRLSGGCNPEDYSHLISATEGAGLDNLKLSLQDRVLSVSDTLATTLRIPMNGQQLQWLYKEATVINQHSLVDDTEHMLANVVMSPATRAKFKAKFGGDFIHREPLKSTERELEHT